jgi:hypothetical protein
MMPPPYPGTPTLSSVFDERSMEATLPPIMTRLALLSPLPRSTTRPPRGTRAMTGEQVTCA